MSENIEIRECTTFEELENCVMLQREVFVLPDIELSPVRHLVVTKNAGGFILGAFADGELIGFVLSVPAFLRGEPAIYSHMTAVKAGYQSYGIGAKLKWAQRTRALAEGIKTIKWTFEPWRARNAYFNLEKLGAVAVEYQPNFYGVDYATSAAIGKRIGLASDRLFAEWYLESEKVNALAKAEKYVETRTPDAEIAVTSDWAGLLDNDIPGALAEQTRLKKEFGAAFDKGLIVGGFVRGGGPKYLLYKVHQGEN
jgi:predicted GNAT superfamily acetyltransferase